MADPLLRTSSQPFASCGRAPLIVGVWLGVWAAAVCIAGAGTATAGAAGAGTGGAGGRGGVSGGGGGAGADGVAVMEGRTTELFVGPRVGRPLERDPQVLSHAPSYRRAIEKDRDLRWGEAAVLYQQALLELSGALRLGSSPALERALYKVERERQRSATLAALAEMSRPATSGPGAPAPVRPLLVGPTPAQALDRARLLRFKLMTVRSATGVVPGGLLALTQRTLEDALRRPAGAEGGGGDPEVRLLLCATRAVAGERARARLEAAYVSDADRLDPARALPSAICAAALGDLDQALADLAVAVHRQSAGNRFDLGQGRDLYTSNDWDPLRGDPRFEALF